MNVLLLFATYSGGTEVAAQTVEEVLKTKGHTVTMKNPKETSEDELKNSELTVLCTPTWDFSGKEGQPHEDFLAFTEKFKSNKFDGKKFAICGLGDSSYAKFCGSVDELETFVKNVSGMLAVPSLKIDGFFYDQTKNTDLVKNWAQTLG